MRRRAFIALAGGAAAMPFAAHGQQPAFPVVGFLDSRTPDAMASRLGGFRRGLKETGFIEGESVTILYRWAENQSDRLPELAGQLVRQHVAVIVASGGPAVGFAGKGATSTTPIVFLTAEDPVRLGLVASLARPGGNLTGINFFNRELAAKQLELLRELVPAAARIGVLVNPANARLTETTVSEVERAARAMGLQIRIFPVSTSREIDAAFATFAGERPDALFIGEDPFLNARRVQLALLAGRHAMPTIHSGREHAEAGGLMSYGSDITDAYRQVGVYVGRILRGSKPAELPIVQASKFELVINHQTARTLGIAVPQTLLTAADEVIE
jgi:putative ABC transport system substrate-binding protein